ncbi:Cysteine desulfurase [Citrifermentans bremense]|uniref:cysteine desulfurase n=1 Tax=Citrifermentans bremense TaxID=60035 RepID=A0A6S6LUZ1_9BACT|nr:aminotransferase class V-fold PLP-dependent enzyme [Citrifermentans bremense]BCG45473.1 Cysteine desulfurase [Citrifermentans bremense]
MAVYLDCNSTTPVEPSVASLVLRFLEKDFGNAASPIHDYGLFARSAVEHARMLVGKVVGARPDEVLFTSGATESNNMAILGLADAGIKSRRRHVITTAIEHKAVLEPFEELARRGFDVDILTVGPDGRFKVEDLAEALRPDTLLVSTMQANNETGVVHPLAETAKLLTGHDAWWHVDAAQGYGKDLEQLRDPRIDMIAVSGHKIYGPKGVGALILRKRDGLRPPLQPLAFGGGQEQGLRPGTLPVPLIAGFGEAAKLALRDNETRRTTCLAFRRLVHEALDRLGAGHNGDETWTMPHCVNVSLDGIPSDLAINALKGVIALSSTSACTSHTRTPSHVLTAMGRTPTQVETSLRLSWCHMTPEVDWDEVVGILRKIRSRR